MRTIHHIQPGIARIRLPMFGKKPGPVNVYLFKGRNHVALLDTGTFMTAWILKAALGRLNLKFSDIERIVLTHGHLDHQGAVRAIARQRRGLLTVCAHRDEIASIEAGNDAPLKAYYRFLLHTGTPLHHRLAIQTMFFWNRQLTRACRVNHGLEDGDRLIIGDYKATVVATPGHTRGSISLFIEKEGLLFSGDHILGHITPNALPMLESDPRRPMRLSQKEYFNSLETIARLDPRIIYPAHGVEIHDFHGLHKLYRDCFTQRQRAILDFIQKRPEQSIYTIARALFPEIKGKAFVLNLFLALSEIFTHLQVLADEGRARMEEENGILKVGALPS